MCCRIRTDRDPAAGICNISSNLNQTQRVNQPFNSQVWALDDVDVCISICVYGEVGPLAANSEKSHRGGRKVSSPEAIPDRDPTKVHANEYFVSFSGGVTQKADAQKKQRKNRPTVHRWVALSTLHREFCDTHQQKSPWRIWSSQFRLRCC